MRNYILTAAIMAVGLSSAAAAQSAAADPWAKVPTTTSCFVDDGFAEKLGAAATELDAEIGRQTKINADLKAKFNAMDMSEKAQRMQAFMMKNPQQAMKMMQAEQAAGAAVTANVISAEADSKRLEQELTSQQASYRAALDNAVKPVQAQQKQLIETKAKLLGEAAVPAFTTAADHAQYVALIAQENAQHEKACAPYFGPNGSFHTWLSNYRTLISEKMVGNADANEAAVVMQMAIMETPTAGYRSTDKLQAARNFITVATRVYGVRRNKAVPRVELAKK